MLLLGLHYHGRAVVGAPVSRDIVIKPYVLSGFNFINSVVHLLTVGSNNVRPIDAIISHVQSLDLVGLNGHAVLVLVPLSSVWRNTLDLLLILLLHHLLLILS